MKNKLKTKKAIAKRVKRTATGKLLRGKAFTSHLALNKTTKQKRHLRKGTVVSKSDAKRWKNLI